MVFPEVIATSATDEQYMLSPGGRGDDSFTFDGRVPGEASVNVSAAAVLSSAVLYGRRFGGDRLPYSCRGQPAMPGPGHGRVAEKQGASAERIVL